MCHFHPFKRYLKKSKVLSLHDQSLPAPQPISSCLPKHTYSLASLKYSEDSQVQGLWHFGGQWQCHLWKVHLKWLLELRVLFFGKLGCSLLQNDQQSNPPTQNFYLPPHPGAWKLQAESLQPGKGGKERIFSLPRSPPLTPRSCHLHWSRNGEREGAGTSCSEVLRSGRQAPLAVKAPARPSERSGLPEWRGRTL